jgi:putative ABC transport system substrate-binding protein
LPDIVLTNGPVPTVQLRKATRNTPIVFVQVPDPDDLGLVGSLSNPGGNVTGFTHFQSSFGGKWLEVLKEIAPKTRYVAGMSLFGHPAMPGFVKEMSAAAASIAVEVMPAPVRDAREIERAVAELASKPDPGLILLPSPIAPIHGDLIVSLMSRHRIPAIYPFGYFATNGGLISYGVDTADLFRRSATYVDRILKGAKPAELPVQAPTKFQLLINARTAKSLGLTVPSTLLARADEVIE